MTDDYRQRGNQRDSMFTTRRLVLCILVVLPVLQIWTITEHHQFASTGSLIADDSLDNFPRVSSSVTTQGLQSTPTPCRTLCECFHQAVTPPGSSASTNSSFVPPYFPSVPSLWRDHVHPRWNHFEPWDVGNITSDNTKDIRRIYREWLDRLFDTLTPHRLQKAWKASPSPASLQAIYEILNRRFQHPHTAPPLRIAVLGGSVTAGHEFEKNNIGLKVQHPKPSQAKAWPQRMEHLINTLLGFEAVEVWNMAVSATTSDIGSMILQYNLFPQAEDASPPDVLIWSFATNDLASDKTATSATRIREMQHFCTRAQKLRCDDALPLVILVDDLVLHPDHLRIFFGFSADVALVAQWNDALGISIGSALLDVALANPAESSLHAEWMPESDKTYKGRGEAVAGWQRPGRIHPGLGVHISIAGILVFQFLRQATEFCQATLEQQSHPKKVDKTHSLGNPPPKGPLPPYHSKLDSREVLPLWQERAEKHIQECASREEGETRLRCSYAWVSNRMAQMGTRTQLQGWMDKIVVGTPRNWTINGFAAAGPDSEDKVGWEASGANASFVVEHTNHLVRDAIRKITVVCMHSYGRKWKDSRLQVVVQKKDDRSSRLVRTLLTRQDLIGFHTGSSRTSNYVPYELELSNETSAIEPGETLRMEFRLIGGTTFKILGLTFCAD